MMNVTLGPITYCWPKEQVLEFYKAVTESNINTVYLGETICSRRRELSFKDYLTIAHTLAEAGKEVVLSTLALLETPSEYVELKKQVNNGHFIIEANDMGAIEAAKEAKLPFISGTSINQYNLATLQLLHSWGMQRFVMPVELSRQWLKSITDSNKVNFDIEVLGYGHLPLALSARCFTAKHHGITKDKCGTICANYSKGIIAQTQESQPLLRLNGIQTQSAACIDLRPNIKEMLETGVTHFRVSPLSLKSVSLAAKLQQELQQELQSVQSLTTFKDNDSEYCNGYWFDDAGMKTR